MTLTLRLKGTPIPKQSARIGRNKKTGRPISYTNPQIKAYEEQVKWIIKSQLPTGFHILDEPIGVDVAYVFEPPKSWSKNKMDRLIDGEIFFKATKPDLDGNLNKALFDAMEGIVYVNDSRIAKCTLEKTYGVESYTLIEIFTLYS